MSARHESPPPVDSPAPAVPFLHRTIPGEYFSLLSLVVASSGVIYWSVQVVQCHSALALVATHGWIVLRALGVWSGRRATPVVTGLLLALLLWASKSAACVGLEGWTKVIFSPVLGSLLLAAFLIIDLWEIRVPRRERAS